MMLNKSKLLEGHPAARTQDEPAEKEVVETLRVLDADVVHNKSVAPQSLHKTSFVLHVLSPCGNGAKHVARVR